MMRRTGSTQVHIPESVRDALDVLRSVPAPDAAAWSASRAAFLDEVHTYAEEAAPVPAADLLPISWWRRLRKSAASRVAFLLHDRGPVAVAFKVMLVMALAMAGSVGTLRAARSSLPGSSFYPLKIRVETWEIDRARSHGDVLQMALAQANRRVDEATRLRDRGDPVPEEIALLYQQRLDLAISAAGDLDPSVRHAVETEISGSVAQQLRVLERYAARVGGNPEADDALEDDPSVRMMIQTMYAAQARLGQNGNPPDAPAGPPHPAPVPDEPVVDELPVVEPTTTADPTESAGQSEPGSGSRGDVVPVDGSNDDEPGGVMPGRNMPSVTDDGPASVPVPVTDNAPVPGPGPATDDGDTGGSDAPGPGPAHSQDDDTGGADPGSDDGSHGDSDDVGGPGAGDRGSNGDSDSESQSESGGFGDSGRP